MLSACPAACPPSCRLATDDVSSRDAVTLVVKQLLVVIALSCAVMPLTAAPQTWQGVDRPEPLQLAPVNLNGQTLRISSGAFRMYVVSGSGAILQDGPLANSGVFQSTWTGPLTVTSGTFTLNGTSGAAVINGGTLTLYAGSPANVTLNSGTLDVENFSSTGPSH